MRSEGDGSPCGDSQRGALPQNVAPKLLEKSQEGSEDKKLVGWRGGIPKTIVLTGRVIGVKEWECLHISFREVTGHQPRLGTRRGAGELGVLGATLPACRVL